MKKIYLASFLEPENFGPGRVIGITNGTKPQYIDVSLKFLPLTPDVDIIDKYYELSKQDKNKASSLFIDKFKSKLDKFESDVLEKSKKNNKNPEEILPFNDGDTLASWERFNNTNYRGMVGVTLSNLGFDVVIK